MELITTRFAPSPTGNMHIGSMRAALLPYCFTKKNSGKFILRIDDTDISRCNSVFLDDIIENLKWMKIKWDIFFKQSERKDRYEEVFEMMKKNNLIYPCYESESDLEQIRFLKSKSKKAPIITREDCIKEVGSECCWRFELSNTMHFDDLIFGSMSFNRIWSDPVIKRSDGSFCYIFTSMLDDHDYLVNWIIRGSEHISNAAIQNDMGNKICSLLGKKWKMNWAHFPLFLDQNGGKLSKRENSLSISDLRKDGLEKWTLWSFLTQVGSSNKTIMSYEVEDYINQFELSKFFPVPKKLFLEELWERNKKFIRSMPFDCVKERFENETAWNLLKENYSSFSEIQQVYYNILKFKKSMGIISETESKKEIYMKITGFSYGPPLHQINELLESL